MSVLAEGGLGVTGCGPSRRSQLAHSSHGDSPPGPKCQEVRGLVCSVHHPFQMLGVVPVTQQEPNKYLLNKGTDETFRRKFSLNLRQEKKRTKRQ